MRYLAALTSLALLSGCATMRMTYPERSATEELLITDAAEDAAAQIALSIPRDKLYYLDAVNMDSVDGHYALSSIREKLMEQGFHIMETRESATAIIEVRSGALSIDSHGTTIIIPVIPAESVIPHLPTKTPNSFYSAGKTIDEGYAKFTMFVWDKSTGTIIGKAVTVIGHSSNHRYSVQQLIIKPS